MKRLTTFFIILLSVLLIGGCGSSSQPASQQPNDNVKETEQQQNKFEQNEFEFYKDKLQIHDVEISVHNDNTYVVGYVKNTGEKTVKNVEVKVYYLDNNEKAISEYWTYALVNNDNTEIKPNYDSRFVFRPDYTVLKFWGNKVKTEIINIEFVD